MAEPPKKMSEFNSCSGYVCTLKSGLRPSVRYYVALLLLLMGGLTNLGGKSTVAISEGGAPEYRVAELAGEYGEFAEVALLLLDGRKERIEGARTNSV